MKKRLLLFTIALMLLFVTACTNQPAEEPAATEATSTPEATPTEEVSATEAPTPEIDEAYKSMVLSQEDTTVTIKDACDNEVTINKNPQKVILLQNSLLDLWYLAGGEAIAKLSGTTSVPEAALDLPDVGKATAPNAELLLAQEPDLVVMNATTGSHKELESVLKENGIQYFYTGTSVNPYQSIMSTLYTFTQIIDDDTAMQEILTIEKDVHAILAKADAHEKAPKILVLFGSTKSVKCEMDNGLVGEMCAMLGGENVVQNVNIEDTTRTDFSMETIVAQNPDYILVVTMGDVDGVKERMAQDIESNEAWASLTAVQEEKVYFLPKDLYMYKPNGRYAEAFQGLYDIIYAE